MLKSYEPAHIEETTEKFLEFLNEDGCGYSFDLDEDDRPILSSEAAKASWELCQKTYPNGGQRKVRMNRYRVPAMGVCQCGAEIPLTGGYYGATECDCGRWYNVIGQEILPPKMWEEDLEEWD